MKKKNLTSFTFGKINTTDGQDDSIVANGITYTHAPGYAYDAHELCKIMSEAYHSGKNVYIPLKYFRNDPNVYLSTNAKEIIAEVAANYHREAVNRVGAKNVSNTLPQSIAQMLAKYGF